MACNSDLEQNLRSKLCLLVRILCVLVQNMIHAPNKNIVEQMRRRHKSARTCVACGRSGPLEIDHILPRSKGGSDHILNLQFLCRKCNTQKGAKLSWVKTVGGESK